MRGLFVLIAASSVADGAPVRLEIRGDACELDGLEAKIQHLVPDARFDDDATARMSIATRKTDGGVIARMIHDGEREIRAATCDELVESLALIIAMTVPASETKTSVAPISPIAPIAIERIEGSPVSSRRPSAWSAVAGGAGSPTSEGWVTRAILGLRWRRHDRSIAVEVRASSPMDEYVTAAAKIRVWDATVAFTPCVHIDALAVCTSVAGGFIRGTSNGLVDARSRTSPSLSVGGRLEWTFPVVGRLGLRLHLDGDAYLTTTRFDVNYMPRWSHDRVEVRGGIGAVAQFR